MAEYFDTRSKAEQFVQEWHSKNGSTPSFFGKIFNNGREKWIVNYDARQDPSASPHITVLEDATSQLDRIIASTPAHVSKPVVKSSVSEALYSILTGDHATALAIREQAFNAGDGAAAFITFSDPPPSLSASTNTMRVTAYVTCACNNAFPFEMTFTGGRGGADGKCPACAVSFTYGFHYSASGYQTGVFLYFCPSPRFPLTQVVIDDITLMTPADRQALKAEAARREAEKRQRQEQLQREISERAARLKLEREEAVRRDAERAAVVSATKRRRQVAGQCPMCGGTLGWLAKIRRQSQHGHCSTFQD